MKKEYADYYKDPRWQKKRLEILQRDNWKCILCGNKEEMLVVHHMLYEKDKKPWEYVNDNLVTLCDSCHEQEHETRNEYENLLLLSLRNKHFFADDIYLLAEAIGFMDIDKNKLWDFFRDSKKKSVGEK